MATTSEKRQNQRFPMELPLELSWQATEGPKDAKATVHDISSSGVYFYLPEKLESDGKLEFYVKLQEKESAVPGIFLHCLGSIVRVDSKVTDSEHKGQVGVAVKIDRYRFLKPEEKMPPDKSAGS